MTNYERLCRTLQGQSVDRFLTWDFIDNDEILTRYGGYDPARQYDFAELLDLNARAIKRVGLDMTRGIYNPARPWLNDKVANWVRFLGVDPTDWQVSQAGGTGWISKRPFSDLRGLEKHLPRPPVFEEVAAWFQPLLAEVRGVADHYDLAWVQGVEGPLSDAYIYTDRDVASDGHAPAYSHADPDANPELSRAQSDRVVECARRLQRLPGSDPRLSQRGWFE